MCYCFYLIFWSQVLDLSQENESQDVADLNLCCCISNYFGICEVN